MQKSNWGARRRCHGHEERTHDKEGKRRRHAHTRECTLYENTPAAWQQKIRGRDRDDEAGSFPFLDKSGRFFVMVTRPVKGRITHAQLNGIVPNRYSFVVLEQSVSVVHNAEIVLLDCRHGELGAP